MSTRIQGASFIEHLLTDLLGRPTAVQTTRPLGPPRTGAVAVYRDPAGRLAAVALFDLRFAAYTGAAMRLIPARTVRVCEAEGLLTAPLREQFTEVASVCSRFFRAMGAPGVALAEIHFLPGALPDEIRNEVHEAAERCDLDVSIDGYGTGYVALLAA